MNATLKNKRVDDFKDLGELFSAEEIKDLPREAVVKQRKKKEKKKKTPLDTPAEVVKFIPPKATSVDSLSNLEELLSSFEKKEMGSVRKKPLPIITDEEIPKGDFSDVESLFLKGIQDHAFEMSSIKTSDAENTSQISFEIETVEVVEGTAEFSNAPKEDIPAEQTIREVVCQTVPVVKPKSEVINMLPEKRNTVLAWNPEIPKCFCGCTAFRANMCKYHWRDFVRAKKFQF